MITTGLEARDRAELIGLTQRAKAMQTIAVNAPDAIHRHACVWYHAAWFLDRLVDLEHQRRIFEGMRAYEVQG